MKNLLEPYDFVISAVPGYLGFQTLKAVIEAKKNVVDIAFFSEDPFLLDDLAKRNEVTAIVDCGVSPGMSSILVGYVERMLEETYNVNIYVGGLPEDREWPYEFKAGFSPIDVIEEYIRPARYIENGKDRFSRRRNIGSIQHRWASYTLEDYPGPQHERKNAAISCPR